MAAQPPKIENAPGVVWKPRKDAWECRWQARTDLVKRGYTPKSMRIWAGAADECTERVVAFIQERAEVLQTEMLVWGRGGVPTPVEYDGTLGGLIKYYQTDADSPYRKNRYASRQNSDSLCRRLAEAHGHERIEDIKARTVLRWYEVWAADGKIAMGHSMVTKLRTLVGFGMTILECDDCAKLSAVLNKMRFAMTKPRKERLTADQVSAVIAKAHEKELHSIALAQAFQFELMLRQKDCIGEWVPMSETGASEVLYGNEKWLRGIRWSEIDENLILTHTTSKRQKEIIVDLKLAPMVMAELRLLAGIAPDAELTRDMLPASGPIVVSERTGWPHTSVNFRATWRKLADECGIPKTVKNMDSRAGGISEATDAGADLEHIRHAATHSDIAMTQKYSRGQTEKIAGVMQKRTAHRNKAGKSEA